MANPLTGDYEAVVQIAIRQINGLLGTMHQNAATQDAALKLLHSTTLRIGDPRTQTSRCRRVRGLADPDTRRLVPAAGLRDIRAQLTAMAPPGAARMLSDAFAGFDRDWVVEYPAGCGARQGQAPGVVRHGHRAGWLVVRGHRTCSRPRPLLS